MSEAKFGVQNRINSSATKVRFKPSSIDLSRAKVIHALGYQGNLGTLEVMVRTPGGKVTAHSTERPRVLASLAPAVGMVWEWIALGFGWKCHRERQLVPAKGSARHTTFMHIACMPPAPFLSHMQGSMHQVKNCFLHLGEAAVTDFMQPVPPLFAPHW